MDRGLGKPVIITRPDGLDVEYPSIQAAAVGEKIAATQISWMCQNCKGYKARFKKFNPVSTKAIDAIIEDGDFS
jgi:hypothetical protein